MYRNLYDILHDVSKSSMVDEGDLQATGLLILTAAMHGLNINRAGIWVLSDDKQTICASMLIDGDEYSLNSSVCLARADFPNYFGQFDSERAIVAHNAIEDPATSEFTESYLNPNNISSLLDVPIRHRGHMLGVICCEHQGPARIWSNEEIAFAGALADTYGRAISASQRNDYERQLKTINDQLEQKVIERTEYLENALRSLNRTQAKLIESEKLASLGRLVAGLAHEINTPLGIAVTSASHGESELKQLQQHYKNETLSEELFTQLLDSLSQSYELINHNLQRAASLVQSFKLSGSIHTANEEERFALRECIELSLKGLGPLLKKNAAHCSLVPGEEITLVSYPGAIAQIITNLVTNSLDHAFSNTIDRQIFITLETRDQRVLIHYSDCGCGIADAIRDKIFEPFFTTARKTGGSGLGLSIVYNLVTQKLKGEIQLDADQSHGAAFTITLPIKNG